MTILKKIESKFQITSLFALATILIISTVQFAQAEPTNTITGISNGEKIYIGNNGTNNLIIISDSTGEIISEYSNLTVREYDSGSFKMNNTIQEIRVFANPTFGDFYKLIIKTSDGTRKLLGASQVTSQLHPVPFVMQEPTSSLGADIIAYDIPVDTSRDPELEYLMTFTTTRSFDHHSLNEKFEVNGYLYSIRNNTVIEGADVTLEISRDDYIIKTVKETTGIGGKVHITIEDMEYPLFRPSLCYDIKITSQNGNYTHIQYDDFKMKTPFGNNNWEADMSWLDLQRWNYLPSDFRSEPRTLINEDEHCN